MGKGGLRELRSTRTTSACSSSSSSSSLFHHQCCEFESNMFYMREFLRCVELRISYPAKRMDGKVVGTTSRLRDRWWGLCLAFSSRQGRLQCRKRRGVCVCVLVVVGGSRCAMAPRH